MSKIEEGHPIWEAIDNGGGQCCDIRGVLRELERAGYVIVPAAPTIDMCSAGNAMDVTLEQMLLMVTNKRMRFGAAQAEYSYRMMCAAFAQSRGDQS